MRDWREMCIRDRLGLDQTVLSGGGVQHQQGLPVAAGQLPVHDAADLVQLVHQVLLVVQPPGGVHKHHVALPGLGGTHSVKDYGGGVGPLVLLDDIHPSPVGPDGQLLGGGGPEGIRGAEEDLLSLLSELMADLADGGSLTHPIHSNKQYHRGGGGQVQSRTPGVHGLSDDLDHGGAGLLHGLNPLLPHPAAQRLHQFQGHVHPSIGQDEGLLQLVVEAVSYTHLDVYKRQIPAPAYSIQWE